MNAFLKLALIVLCALLAVKFLPEMFAFGCMLAATLLGLMVVGLPILAVLFAGFLALVVLLAPVWLPVLVICGVIALVRRSRRGAPLQSV